MKKNNALIFCFLISASYFSMHSMDQSHQPVALASTALKNAGNVSNGVHKSEGTNAETGAKIIHYMVINTGVNATKAQYCDGSVEYTAFKGPRISATSNEAENFFAILEKEFLKKAEKK